MEKAALQARLNAIDSEANWQSAVRTLRAIIEDLNEELESKADADDGEA
jgi:hypothetical protein